MAWPGAPAPARRQRGLVTALISAGVVLLILCCGVPGAIIVFGGGENEAGPEPTAPALSSSGALPSSPAGPDQAEEPEDKSPQPSEYTPTEISDLNRVCDENIYYPRSPKRAGKAPHPVALLVSERPGIRTQDTYYFNSLGYGKTLERTWAPTDVRKVQVVACLDRIGAGKKIRTCSYEIDSKPGKVSLIRGRWRLRVYEVATGRRLLEKTMTGDNQSCPYFALMYDDRKIYSEVSGKAVIQNLSNLVTR